MEEIDPECAATAVLLGQIVQALRTRINELQRLKGTEGISMETLTPLHVDEQRLVRVLQVAAKQLEAITRSVVPSGHTMN